MNSKRKTAADWGLPTEKSLVIIYGAGKFLLQQKDILYRECFRNMFTFFGAGLKMGETPEMALGKRLIKEVPGISENICAKMEYWKIFELPWGRDKDGNIIDGGYICHAYVMLTGEKHMADLQYNAYLDGGKRQGSIVLLNLEGPRGMRDLVTQERLMGSLHLVVLDFLQEIKQGKLQL